MVIIMMTMMMIHGRWSVVSFGAAAGDLGNLVQTNRLLCSRVRAGRAAQDYYYHYLCYYYYNYYSLCLLTVQLQWCAGVVLYCMTDPRGGCSGEMRFTIDVKRLYALSPILQVLLYYITGGCYIVIIVCSTPIEILYSTVLHKYN